MRAVDAFCCSGGTSVGLKWAGFDVVMGLDVDLNALSVYRMHHTKGVELDLGDTERAIACIRDAGPIELLAGSPPCTDYSSAGRRVEQDSVAGLTVSFARIAAALRVPCVLVENVPEMLSSQSWCEARDVLLGAGYSLVVLRVNSAACGVAQVRRRVFVIGVLGCDEEALRSVQREAAGLNRTPVNVATVRSCLTSPVDTYWYPARNTHSPCVRSTDDPAPTLRCNCSGRPPACYVPRHDDVGPVADVHVLTVQELAAIASFPRHYFDSTSRTAAAKFVGNCVCPRVAEVVGGWCMRLLRSPPSESIARPLCLTSDRRHASRVSRLQRLVNAGLLECGAEMRDDGLHYVGGASPGGDEMVRRILSWTPAAGWRLHVRPRGAGSASSGQAPNDDLLIYKPGESQGFRSIRQVTRYLANVSATQTG